MPSAPGRGWSRDALLPSEVWRGSFSALRSGSASCAWWARRSGCRCAFRGGSRSSSYRRAGAPAVHRLSSPRCRFPGCCRSRGPSAAPPCSVDRRGESRARCGRRCSLGVSRGHRSGIHVGSRNRRRRRDRARSGPGAGSGSGCGPSRSSRGTSSNRRTTRRIHTSDGAPPGTTANRRSRRSPRPGGASPTRARNSPAGSRTGNRTTDRTTRSTSSPRGPRGPSRRGGRNRSRRSSPTSPLLRKSRCRDSRCHAPAGGPGRLRPRPRRRDGSVRPDRSRSTGGP